MLQTKIMQPLQEQLKLNWSKIIILSTCLHSWHLLVIPLTKALFAVSIVIALIHITGNVVLRILEGKCFSEPKSHHQLKTSALILVLHYKFMTNSCKTVLHEIQAMPPNHGPADMDTLYSFASRLELLPILHMQEFNTTMSINGKIYTCKRT